MGPLVNSALDLMEEVDANVPTRLQVTQQLTTKALHAITMGIDAVRITRLAAGKSQFKYIEDLTYVHTCVPGTERHSTPKKI
ncbi:hypothetical protein OUZ56_008540 [Daphnia magna]|uniref:Uncharacterized protein n=1 Tax=Daphnia magna TaxID=35525 RepID=A0ABR0ADF4_9CRUS|nr:hypothetical protein OUZ56_008540 [Daphnia magna]